MALAEPIAPYAVQTTHTRPFAAYREGRSLPARLDASDPKAMSRGMFSRVVGFDALPADRQAEFLGPWSGAASPVAHSLRSAPGSQILRQDVACQHLARSESG